MTAPIGVFDSGVGGTSIWREIHTLMPYENTIYLADSKNAPYGNKKKSEILSLSIKNTEALLQLGCKIIVVACNTATTNAIEYLRNNYDVPFIGIEPAIKPAALRSRSKKIGVLATKGTLNSDLFHKTTETFTNGTSLIEVVGKGLVPLIEQGIISGPQINKLLIRYTEPMLEESIDHIVLGCSHYPYLIPALRKILPLHVKIIDSGEAVAKQTKAILEQNDLISNSKKTPRHQFYINAKPDTLQKLLKDHKDTITIETGDF